MKDSLKDALRKLYILSGLTEAERPDIPPTREELMAIGVSKKDLKELERKGFCRSTILFMKDTGKHVGRSTLIVTKDGVDLCEKLGYKKAKPS